MRQVAKIIKDSITSDGYRLMTVEMEYHRFIHPEWMTYRTFSRNSASSRAIPVEKEIQKIFDDPAIPYLFGSNQSGMQAGAPLEGEDLQDAINIWIEAAEDAATHARRLLDLGVHKEVTNRLLEPFLWHKVIFTANSFDHMFSQRIHPDAQAEIRIPATQLRDAIDASVPTLIESGEYHTPYVDDIEDLDLETRIKVSVARCARVSYLSHDGTRSIDKDIELYERLIAGNHMSPLEHVATPIGEYYVHSNIKGWNQLRGLKEKGLPEF